MLTTDQESDSHIVELVDDDPEAVDIMIDFFYIFDIYDFVDQLEMSKVYALADKYGCKDLKPLAARRFDILIQLSDSDLSMTEAAMRHVYESTPDSDRGLRDICCQQFERWAQRRNKGRNAEVRALLEAVPAFAVDVAKSQLKDSQT